MGTFQPLKRKILPHVATWMNLEDILQNEVSPTEKGPYRGISLTPGSEQVGLGHVGGSTGEASAFGSGPHPRVPGCLGWGQGNGDLPVKTHKFLAAR